jgi:hypothetical protein
MNQITSATKEKHDQELALIQDAHKAWQEVHGMDIAGMPDGVRKKVAELNTVYNQALQDGKISPKEALEISAYAGMVKRAVGAGKEQQTAGREAEASVSKVGADFAGRAEQQRLAGAEDPQAAAAGGLKYDLEKPIRDQKLKEKALSDKVDIANIRAKASLARIKKVTDGMDPKRGDQIFRTYMSAIGRAMKDDDPETAVSRVEDAFTAQYGATSPTGHGAAPWMRRTEPPPGGGYDPKSGVPFAPPIQLAPGITATRR